MLLYTQLRASLVLLDRRASSRRAGAIGMDCFALRIVVFFIDKFGRALETWAQPSAHKAQEGLDKDPGERAGANLHRLCLVRIVAPSGFQKRLVLRDSYQNQDSAD